MREVQRCLSPVFGEGAAEKADPGLGHSSPLLWKPMFIGNNICFPFIDKNTMKDEMQPILGCISPAPHQHSLRRLSQRDVSYMWEWDDGPASFSPVTVSGAQHRP